MKLPGARTIGAVTGVLNVKLDGTHDGATPRTCNANGMVDQVRYQP